MVDVILDAKESCDAMQKRNEMISIVNFDWDSIEKMSKAWHTPLTFAYHDGTEITINNKNIYQWIY